MKVLRTLMLLIATPFLILIGFAGVILSTFQAVYNQILHAWEKS